MSDPLGWLKFADDMVFSAPTRVLADKAKTLGGHLEKQGISAPDVRTWKRDVVQFRWERDDKEVIVSLQEKGPTILEVTSKLKRLATVQLIVSALESCPKQKQET